MNSKYFISLLATAFVSIISFTSCDQTDNPINQNTSCNSDGEITNKSTDNESTTDAIWLLKDYSLFITKGIYNNAYEKQYGNIDYEAAKNVMLSYAFTESAIDLSPCFELTYTRTSGNDLDKELKEQLTNNQYTLLKELISKEKLTDKDLEDIRKKTLTLEKSEQELILYILDASQAIIDGVMSGISEVTTLTRANESSKFACNLAAGAVGAVTGFLAGCLSGPAAGIVGPVVSTTVGAYISTKAC